MAVLNLEMGPEEAVSVLNGHDHASGVGKPISTEGLADKAVTRNKLTEKVIGSEQLDDQSIGTTHIQQGAITKELLAAGLLNQELSSKVLGQKNFIVSGMDIQVDLMNGAPLLKNPGGKVNLAEQYIDVAASTIPLTATPSSGMVYCQKEISKEVCVKTVQFKWPVLDNMVVHHYEFDDTGTVVNDKTANQNNLIAGGTKADEVERVAGSFGYGRKISVNSNLLSQGNVYDFNQTKKIAILADFIYKDYKSTTTANFMIASLNGFYFRVYNSTGELYLHFTVRQSREVNNLEPRCNINSVAQLALTYSLFRNRRLIFIGAMQSTSIVKQFNIFKDRLFDFSSGFEFSPIQPFTFQLWTFLGFLSNWRVLSFETMIIRQVLHKK